MSYYFNAFSFFDINRSVPSVSGVYYLLDHKFDICYVGKSNNLKRRLLDHRMGRTHIDCELVQYLIASEWDHKIITQLEGLLITFFKPYMNRHKPSIHDPIRWASGILLNMELSNVLRLMNRNTGELQTT